MKLFVGLGNPGENHSKNRHNIGFMVVDTIVNRYGGTPWKKKFQGLASEVILKQEKLIFLKPSTFMNLSGQSVSDACRFFKLSSTEICVFHDELDLPFLKIRTKIGGGHAGHNGLRSIQQHLGSDYFRVRLGIGHPGDRAKVASYVLNNFPKSSEADLSSWLEAVAEGFPQLKEANQEKFLNIVNGQSNTAKKTSDGKVPRTKLAPSNEPLNISKETKKSALERLLEKFR
jgi:PTH1 family peptidyl-tRNA hydrolase|tara:strand:- start:350 stop:1039 length:690 start_codon:yes stop_codon:yes gene_type:complete